MNDFESVHILRLSEALYRRVLHLYPADFRETYGVHMARTFRDCLRECYQRRGFGALLPLWAATLLDLLKTAAEEHMQRSIEMSKTLLSKIAGPTLMLGGLLWMLSGLHQFETIYWDEFGGFDLVYEIGGILFGAAILPLVIGLIGLHLTYKERVGSLGRLGLLAPYGGLAITLVALAYSLLNPAVDDWWYGFMMGLLLIMCGMILFGIDALRRSTFPRWNYAPLVAGAPFVLTFTVAGAVSLITGNALNIPSGWYGFAAFVITGLGWMMTGYAVMTDEQTAPIPAV